MDTMLNRPKGPWTTLEGSRNFNDGEVVSAADCLKISGLDWDVFKLPLFSSWIDSDAGMLTAVDVPASGTFRMVDGKPFNLGIVGNDYSILQNHEAFKAFDPFFESGDLSIETAGSLKGGKKVWVLARIKGDDLEVTPNDVVCRYILLSNTHDGSGSVKFGFTPVRVVCANTLAMAHKHSASKLLKLKHKGQVVLNLQSLTAALDLANNQFIATVEQYKELTKIQMNQETLRKYVKQVFSVSKLEEQLADSIIESSEDERKSAIVKKLEDLFTGSPGNAMEGVRGTAWAAYNAVTYYNQYDRGNSKTSPDSRMSNVWFGDAQTINNKALNLALALK